jgi:hypothetical protein
VAQENPLTKWSTIGNVILVGGAAFCILVVFYLFYHYSVTGERQFASPIGMVSSYCLPAALATLLLGALRLEHSRKINLAISFLSLAISIYAAELFLAFSDLSSYAARPIWGGSVEITKRKYEILELARKFGVEFDTRSKLAVLNDLSSRGIDAVPDVTPMGLLRRQEDGSLKSELTLDGEEVLPLGGVSNRATVSCNETGEYFIYTSDEHGFNNPKGIWQPGRVPIVALGDSFTLGGCVRPDKGFVALIRNHFPGTLNLGMAGEGPFSMLAALKEYAPAMKPKIVLWFYYDESDIEDLQTERQSRLLTRYLGNDFSQNLLSRQGAIDQAVLDYIRRYMTRALAKEQQEVADNTAITAKLKEIAKVGTLRQKLGLLAGVPGTKKNSASETTEAELELLETILSQAKATVATWGGTLYFVYLPAWERYGNPQLLNKTGARYRDRVLSTAKRLGIPIIDIHPAFQAQKDPLSLFSFRRFGHYNEEGHNVVARQVLRSVGLGH